MPPAHPIGQKAHLLAQPRATDDDGFPAYYTHYADRAGLAAAVGCALQQAPAPVDPRPASHGYPCENCAGKPAMSGGKYCSGECGHGRPACFVRGCASQRATNRVFCTPHAAAFDADTSGRDAAQWIAGLAEAPEAPAASPVPPEVSSDRIRWRLCLDPGCTAPATVWYGPDGPGPFCAQHERQRGAEWVWCAQCSRAWAAVVGNENELFCCGSCGGSDYAPQPACDGMREDPPAMQALIQAMQALIQLPGRATDAEIDEFMRRLGYAPAAIWPATRVPMQEFIDRYAPRQAPIRCAGKQCGEAAAAGEQFCQYHLRFPQCVAGDCPSPRAGTTTAFCDDHRTEAP